MQLELDRIIDITREYIYSNYLKQDVIHIENAVYELTGLNLDNASIKNSEKKEFDYDFFQYLLSSISENALPQKKNGVFYTDDDVTKFMVANAINNLINKHTSQVYSYDHCISNIKKIPEKDIANITCFDPTCGAGQFLVSYCNTVAVSVHSDNDNFFLELSKKIFGNDISRDAVLIAKIRVFFEIIRHISDKKKFISVARNLKKNFFCYDFVTRAPSKIKKRFDIIIGNPPYIENRLLPVEPTKNWGNSYANVLDNIRKFEKNNTVIAFVIPISFVSTPRMREIREVIFSNFKKTFLINFSDRPDTLFKGVHQKLTILISSKNQTVSNDDGIYSSTYNYWYKEEREQLLNNVRTEKINLIFDNFIPKIGSKIEKSIFFKLIKNNGTCLLDLMEGNNKGKEIYLNSRETFWAKAFTFNPGSKEYKEFVVDDKYYSIVFCLLNSSLFFFFWVVVSDCWHITKKELNTIFVPDINKKELGQFDKYVEQLEKKLETTKKYIGTKQAQYEYKHKNCKDIIDSIDDKLGLCYKLSKEEIEFVKRYKEKYRLNNAKQSN